MRKKLRLSDKKSTIEALANITASICTMPLITIMFATIICMQINALPLSFVSAIPIVSYMIHLFGMTITALFNRSRIFFLLFVLLLSQLELTVFASGTNFFGTYAIMTLLIPLNIVFFSILVDRGIFTAWGQRIFTIIFIQTFITLGLAMENSIIQLIYTDFINLSFLPATPIPDIAIIAFFITGILLLVKRTKANAPFKAAAFGTLIATALAFHFHSIPFAISLFYGTGGLILTFSVIQDYYSLAYIDELTDLPSRRALNEELMKLSDNYVIAMLDIDFFKNFNDTYGHSVGDDALRLVAIQLQQVEGGGKPFRYGGEEFTILFPGKSLFEALPYLEELREKIAKRSLILRDPNKNSERPRQKLSITISIGIAESTFNYPTPEKVLKAADEALYRAKGNGRNCICS